MTASHGLRRRSFDWAFRVGRKGITVAVGGTGSHLGLLALQYALADRLVFSKIKSQDGWQDQFLVSGSAPLSR